MSENNLRSEENSGLRSDGDSSRDDDLKTTSSEPVDLTIVLSGLLISLANAKHQADEVSASLAKIYSEDKILRNFTIPAFNIQEIEMDLRFAIQKVEKVTKDNVKIPRILINIDVSTLSRIRIESLTNAKLKIVPTNFRIYQSDDQQVILPG
jgi:hypothetical protein